MMRYRRSWLEYMVCQNSPLFTSARYQYGVEDIINIRFFLCVVKERDPMPIIKKALQMLKPKGWIQWTEQDLSTCKVVSAFADAETKYTEQLKSFAVAPTPDWPVK